MRLWKHRHRFEWADAISEPSIVTGIPLTVAKVYRCRCGESYEERTAAGYQQAAHHLMLRDTEIRRSA